MPAEQHRQAIRDLSRAAVVVPAFEAGHAALELAEGLAAAGYAAVVFVDDGSSSGCAGLLRRAAELPGVRVLRHERNFGKGRALKTGFRHVWECVPAAEVVVTADADGQHRLEDIARVAAAALALPGASVLGVRRFRGRAVGAGVPWRSRVGNAWSRRLFSALHGVDLLDTQTGLRAFPRSLLPWLFATPGERYEYEMAVLAGLCRSSAPEQVEIATVYGRARPMPDAGRVAARESHFRPVLDSLSVIWELVRQGRLRSSAVGSARSSCADFDSSAKA